MEMILTLVLIFWKNRERWVSICLDDAKKLYSGFDLVHALTSEHDS
jgi:hypothetical protein